MVLLSPGGTHGAVFDGFAHARGADRDAGLPAKEVAAKFRVSLSWVNRLMQRRRETGAVGPRPQTVFKKQAFAGQADRLRALVDAQPDRTLAELRESAIEKRRVADALTHLSLGPGSQLGVAGV